ncbi:MAG: cyclic pyranopterin monophosphate synthase MoaC [Bacillota bacterium]
MELTHLDASGKARMVDVSEKPDTRREAVARVQVRMQPGTFQCIIDQKVPKGDVMAVARVAGIMAAKETSRLIPLCHPLAITACSVDFHLLPEQSILEIEARVTTCGTTGVEMEALTAASVAALAVYDMCKALEKGITIEEVRLVSKSGGKSGTYIREGEKPWE